MRLLIVVIMVVKSLKYQMQNLACHFPRCPRRQIIFEHPPYYLSSFIVCANVVAYLYYCESLFDCRRLFTGHKCNSIIVHNCAILYIAFPLNEETFLPYSKLLVNISDSFCFFYTAVIVFCSLRVERYLTAC